MLEELLLLASLRTSDPALQPQAAQSDQTTAQTVFSSTPTSELPSHQPLLALPLNPAAVKVDQGYFMAQATTDGVPDDVLEPCFAWRWRRNPVADNYEAACEVDNDSFEVGVY